MHRTSTILPGLLERFLLRIDPIPPNYMPRVQIPGQIAIDLHVDREVSCAKHEAPQLVRTADASFAAVCLSAFSKETRLASASG
jgi:hypothetical protein